METHIFMLTNWHDELLNPTMIIPMRKSYHVLHLHFSGPWMPRGCAESLATPISCMANTKKDHQSICNSLDFLDFDPDPYPYG
jgi:hypothetical protein